MKNKLFVFFILTQNKFNIQIIKFKYLNGEIQTVFSLFKNKQTPLEREIIKHQYSPIKFHIVTILP